ncbi:MAG: amino acid kinase [Halobacteriota archaeon]|nr:amino acid kinase [Halobacteriota archaeon]
MRVVVKIGGSLIDHGREIIDHLAYYSSASGSEIIVVPGGGPFSDVVRKHSDDLTLDTAHWMAILAMNQFGLFLSDRTKSKVIESFDQLGEGVLILLPYKLLKEIDPLPHSWRVTSDTIAAWVAVQLEAELIKVTDVDGIYMDGSLMDEIAAKDLLDTTTCVDVELPRFLMDEKMNCSIVNGKYPDRITNAIEKKRFIGTVVIGSKDFIKL